MSNDVDHPVTLEEMFDYHIELVDEQAEAFPGELPNQGVSAILRAAQGFDAILRKAEFVRANEDIEQELTEEEIAADLEEQAVDLLAALSNLKREYDLDIEETFQRRRRQMEAIRTAETMEELQEELDKGDLEIVDGLGVEAGDNVDMDDYEPDDPDRGIQ